MSDIDDTYNPDEDTYSGDENLDMVLMYGDENKATVQAWYCRQCGGVGVYG